VSQPFRLPRGGISLDRQRAVRFAFDGRAYDGFAGDSLASALLANGRRLIARSVKYHRPRGVIAIGPEEPNGLVRLHYGARGEPNLRASQVELFHGLVANSQNCWPGPRVDMGAVLGLLSPLLPAGFYYKTFMGPPANWRVYEPLIRRLAGLGRPPEGADPDRYDKRFAHGDVLVAGGGPAGLAAALAAARTGARVILADENPAMGGSLLNAPCEIADRPAVEWVAAAIAELQALPHVTLLPRATVTGYYDHNLLTIVERVSDHLPPTARPVPRQRLWRVRAGEVVLATGAIERPLIFADNDRPGIMLASAVRAYLHRYAVLSGRRAVIATNNDSAYGMALDLVGAGIDVVAIADLREDVGGELIERVERAGIPILTGQAIAKVEGGRAVRAVTLRRLRPSGDGFTGAPTRVEADLVCMSGGWAPSVHLFAQSGGRLAFDDGLKAFVPEAPVQACRSVGAAAGKLTLAAALAEGFAAGAAAAGAAGFSGGAPITLPATGAEADATPIPALWAPPAAARGKSFVDFQNDVTVADVRLAQREGYRSVEHLKRYTTLGMGTDQGKLSNLAGLAILADARNLPIQAVGTTGFRPPYTPVTFATIAARGTEELGHPIRRTALDDWHQRAGALFVNAGLWRRPQLYRRPGESDQACVNREVLAVRNGVGVVDVSTLGKLDLQGPDAQTLLDRVYINGWRNLAVGRGRYGVMLREDGRVFDDGVTMRLGERHFLMTTTTHHAQAVLEHMEFLLQTAWRDLKVYVTPVAEQWFAAAVSGPKARDLLGGLSGDIDFGRDSFPLMAVRQGHVAGVPARLLRVSYSGELAYEVHVPADLGSAFWAALLAAGAAYQLTPYGTEAMGVLRIEKGHIVVGAEADGRTTADDLGLGRLASTTKDFVGRRSLTLPALMAPGRKQLVGIMTEDVARPIPVGAHLVAADLGGRPQASLGHVTSQCYSATLGRHIALALLADGRAREGETLFATSPIAGETVRVKIGASVFVDPEGARAHG
jgi:sarcosine oxidase, subunit alpha